MIDVSRIDLATDENKKYHIDDCAKRFKVVTWEEIKMLAAKNEYLNEEFIIILSAGTPQNMREKRILVLNHH